MSGQERILWITLMIYGVIFLTATVMTVRFRGASWGRDMKHAIISWLVIFLAFILTGYIGAVLFFPLIGILSILAVREFYKLNKKCGTVYLAASIVLTLVALFSLLFEQKVYFFAVPALTVPLFLAIHLVRHSYENLVESTAIHVFGYIYWGWMPLYFLRLSMMDGGFGYLVLLCSMIALNDNCAYYTGKFLGKNSKKLAPRISPNKTWTGFLGGFAATLLCAVLFHYTAPEMSVWKLLILALITATIIPLGDLSESAMKRDLNVKDSSTLIPGHGGVMDRFDSWFFTVPVFYYTLLLLGAK